MHPLRRNSPRPELVVDRRAVHVYDPQSVTRVGRPGPWGRERCLYALPLSEHPPWFKPHTVVHDEDMAYLADADGNLIGRAGVWVPRMLPARWTEDTRRLAG